MTDHPEHLEFVSALPGWVGPAMVVLLFVVVPVLVTWFTFDGGRR